MIGKYKIGEEMIVKRKDRKDLGVIIQDNLLAEKRIPKWNIWNSI